MFSLPHSVYVWVCVCFICVCVTLDGGGDCMLWIFLSRTFFFNVYSKWVHSSQCLTSASPLFKMLEKVATCAICMYKCVCVCVGVDSAVAPTISWHLSKRDTRPQGYKGARAQQRPSFSQASGPLGEHEEDRTGSGLMGFADVCCWRHSLKASSFAWVRCTIINNVNWKETTSWTFPWRWCMWGPSAANVLMFGVLFNPTGCVFREFFRRLKHASRIQRCCFSVVSLVMGEAQFSQV